jgi:hypothetical protein
MQLGCEPDVPIPAFAEAADDRVGALAWAHLDPQAVEAYRWDQWGQYGGRYAPPEHAAEAVARRTRRLAEVEQRREAAAARKEAERIAAHGFRF